MYRTLPTTNMLVPMASRPRCSLAKGWLMGHLPHLWSRFSQNPSATQFLGWMLRVLPPRFVRQCTRRIPTERAEHEARSIGLVSCSRLTKAQGILQGANGLEKEGVVGCVLYLRGFRYVVVRTCCFISPPSPLNRTATSVVLGAVQPHRLHLHAFHHYGRGYRSLLRCRCGWSHAASYARCCQIVR